MIRKQRGSAAAVVRSAVCETLEQRQLLTFVWVNETTDTTFKTAFGTGAPAARAIVERAVADWNRAIPTFNGGVNDRIDLTISAADLGAGFFAATWITGTDPLTQRPSAAEIKLDVNGVNGQWFFDKTPVDDREFGTVLNPYAVQGTQARGVDLYATILHEIGHAAGIASDTGLRINSYLNWTGAMDSDGSFLYSLTSGGSVYAILTTYTGLHLYEGPAIDGHPDWPVYADDLMNAGRTLKLTPPSQPKTGGTPTRVYPGLSNPAVRYLISPTDLKILATVYGYTVVMPPSMSSGTVSVNGTSSADVITASETGNVFTVTRAGTPVVHFKASDVKKLVVDAKAGNDTVTVDASVDVPTTLYGGAGADRLQAGSGPSVLYGNDGSDTLIGGAGACTLYGGKGDDKLWAGTGATSMYGGVGSNVFHVWASNQVLDMKRGIDVIKPLLA